MAVEMGLVALVYWCRRASVNKSTGKSFVVIVAALQGTHTALNCTNNRSSTLDFDCGAEFNSLYNRDNNLLCFWGCVVFWWFVCQMIFAWQTRWKELCCSQNAWKRVHKNKKGIVGIEEIGWMGRWLWGQIKAAWERQTNFSDVTNLESWTTRKLRRAQND